MARNQSNTSPQGRRAPSIKIAFRTFGRTLRHGYDNLGTLVIVSVLWFLGALLIVPLGSVTAALHRVTKPMSEERATNWRNFFDHLRPDLRWGSALTWTLVLGFTVFQANISFYNASPAAGLRMLAIIFGTFMLMWIGIALYAFPLALRQEDRRLRTTLRNAAVMVLANTPGVFVSMVLLALLVIGLSLLPPLFVLIPGVIALWGQENARMLLVESGYLPKDEIADRERIKK